MFAGKLAAWAGAAEGRLVETCCLLTTSANPVCSPVHDRMPVLLDRKAIDRWLDPDLDPAALADVLGVGAPVVVVDTAPVVVTDACFPPPPEHAVTQSSNGSTRALTDRLVTPPV